MLTATMSAQPGPQTDFLRNPADICIYGGAAGGGKTVGLILVPPRQGEPGSTGDPTAFVQHMPSIEFEDMPPPALPPKQPL